MDGVSFAALGFTLFLELFSLVDAYMYVHFLSLVRTIYHRSLSCAGVGCVPSAEMVVLGVGLLGTSRYRALPSFVSFVFSVFFRVSFCVWSRARVPERGPHVCLGAVFCFVWSSSCVWTGVLLEARLRGIGDGRGPTGRARWPAALGCNG